MCAFLKISWFLGEGDWLDDLYDPSGVEKFDWRKKKVFKINRDYKWSRLHPYNADCSILRHSAAESREFLSGLTMHGNNLQGLRCLWLRGATEGLSMSLENECENCAIAYNGRIDELLIQGVCINGFNRRMILKEKSNLLDGFRKWYGGRAIPSEVKHLIRQLKAVICRVSQRRCVGADIFYNDLYSVE